MARRKRRSFSDEFKAETVQLIRSTGKNVAEVSRDLDLTESAVRNWVREADIEDGRGPEGALTKAERDELQIQMFTTNMKHFGPLLGDLAVAPY